MYSSLKSSKVVFASALIATIGCGSSKKQVEEWQSKPNLQKQFAEALKAKLMEINDAFLPGKEYMKMWNYLEN